MANIDRNFLARPDFVVSTGGNGQTITLTLYPILESVGGFEEEVYNLTGWRPLLFAESMIEIQASVGDLPYLSGLPKTITPRVYENFTGSPEFTLTTVNEIVKNRLSADNFRTFVRNNPLHISAINLRAQNENVLPQQIVVETPNIFTGQCTRQIIDVASRKTAYQYQSGIITVADCNFIIARNSSIKFEGAMQVSNGDQPENVLPENELYIDITIDKYLSLEKALVENLKLM